MSTAATETPVLDLLATMTAASLEQSELDPRSFIWCVWRPWRPWTRHRCRT